MEPFEPYIPDDIYWEHEMQDEDPTDMDDESADLFVCTASEFEQATVIGPIEVDSDQIEF